MKINLYAAAPISVAVVLLAGCAGSSDGASVAASPAASPAASAASSATPAASPAPTASTAPAGAAKPKGFTLIADQKNGYQVALPSGFRRISKKSDLDKVMKAGKKALSSKGLVAQLDNKSLKMLSVSSTGNAINVVVNGAGGVTSEQLPELKDELKRQAEQLGGTDIKVRTAALGSEPAIRTDYKIKLSGRSLTLLQYVAVHGDSVYTLTFTEPVKISSAAEEKTVDSWRFL